MRRAPPLLLSVWLLAAGCVQSVDGRPVVRSLVLDGVRNVSKRELASGLATKASRGQLFDEQRLQRDRTRVQRFYEANGYYAANVVRAEGIPRPDRQGVDVRLVIDEGPATRIGDVKLFGIDGLDDKTRKKLQQYQLGLRRGQVFEHDHYMRFKTSLIRELKQRGYAKTKVEGVVDISPETNLADVTITLHAQGVAEAKQ